MTRKTSSIRGRDRKKNLRHYIGLYIGKGNTNLECIHAGKSKVLDRRFRLLIVTLPIRPCFAVTNPGETAASERPVVPRPNTHAIYKQPAVGYGVAEFTTGGETERAHG